uniref:Poly (ADP-ribose) polymerase family, member 12a n=1 Tax=Anabas testudineus TaxID=64144 RepID=A0A7N6AK97_ANATE
MGSCCLYVVKQNSVNLARIVKETEFGFTRSKTRQNSVRMSSTLSKFILKTLCDNQGFLDFERLDKTISQNFTVAESVLRSVLFDDGHIAIQQGRKRTGAAQLICSDSRVVAKTSVRICQKKPGECPQCDALHLCKYYVCGNCTFGNKCKSSHSLASPYNAEILKRYSLHDLTEKQLFQLLLQNDPYLLPEICSHYNKGNSLHGSCKFTTSCTKLHVCLHHFQGDCKFGSSCKRTHDIDTQGLTLFKGFSEENMRNLHEVYRNKLIITGQQAKPVSPTSRNEICLYFIRMHCSFKDKCARVHWHLPYRWQVLDSDGVTWKDLQNMEDIEKAYCDPQHDTSSLHPSTVQSVDFMTMTYGGSSVRRLSTASSVSKPPHYILTTQWLWYWKDENGKWLEYGRGDGDTPASVTSQTLENVYQADRDAAIPFSAGKQQYILNFKGETKTLPMYQQNVKYKTIREVRRRPLFVSAHDVKIKGNSSSTAESVPSHWDKSALPDFGYKLVPLSKSVKDFTLITTLFKRTMPNRTINSIQRIQNPSLWKVFQWQKAQMKERNGGKPVIEQYLFHGTDQSLIEAICEQNFDWRMCGVHGTAYGKGSYFARDASYSDRYSMAKVTKNKIMFVALVLVGEYTKGSSSYVRPPPKGKSRTLYDSCVDCERNPSIYVVFEKQQIYPEYLIDYS